MQTYLRYNISIQDRSFTEHLHASMKFYAVEQQSYRNTTVWPLSYMWNSLKGGRIRASGSGFLSSTKLSYITFN